MTIYGVSIAIPQPWGSQLQAHREAVGDRQARAIPPHITVLPPTEIPDTQLAAFTAHLESVTAAHGPFTVHLRGTGTFRPVSRVVFVQVSQGIPLCERLEQAVRGGPVHRQLEFPYHPHVTVAHDIDEAGLDAAFAGLSDFDARFEVADIHLYEHGDDGVWRPIRAFDLTGEIVRSQ